jgi:hypothetical protein
MAWVGLPLLTGVPRERALGFACLAVVCAVLLALLVGAIQVLVFS